MTQEGRGDRRDAVTEARRLGQPGQLLAPIVPRLLQLPAGAARGLLGVHLGQLAETAGRYRYAAQPRVIVLGNALEQQVAAVTVERNVVHTAVEVVARLALQQGEATRPAAFQLERPANVAQRPGAHPGLGVRLGGDGEALYLQRQRSGLEEGGVAAAHEMPAERLAVVHRRPQRLEQDLGPDLAGKGDALGGVEHRPVLVQQVGRPEPLLRHAERNHAAPPCAWISAHQPLSVGVRARSVKVSSRPRSRHSLSRVMT